MKTLSVAIVLLLCTTSFALPTNGGESEDYWAEGHYSTIVARVEASAHDLTDNTWRAVFVPVCTIAGKFDVSEHPKIEISAFELGRGVPEAGQTVLKHRL